MSRQSLFSGICFEIFVHFDTLLKYLSRIRVKLFEFIQYASYHLACENCYLLIHDRIKQRHRFE